MLANMPKRRAGSTPVRVRRISASSASGAQVIRM